MYARMYVSPSAPVRCIPAFVRALVHECACVCAGRLDVYPKLGMFRYVHIYIYIDRYLHPYDIYAVLICVRVRMRVRTQASICVCTQTDGTHIDGCTCINRHPFL